MNQEATTPAEPVLRILTPDATPEQVAAVVAVFSAMGGTAQKPQRRSEWASVGRRLHVHPYRGPGAWKASSLPY